jgi:long-chain acyl-CoA synthetase
MDLIKKTGNIMSAIQNPAVLNGKTLTGFYPEGTDWNTTIDKITLTTLFDRAVNKYADKPCIDFLGTKISYREMAALVDKAAKGFQELGVEKGTKVGLYMPNTHWYPILFFGAMKAGATVVNFSTQYLENELEHQIKDSGTEIMVTADSPKPDTYGNTVSQLKKSNLDQILVLNLADTLGPDKSWMPGKLKYGLPLIKIINRIKTFFNF